MGTYKNDWTDLTPSATVHAAGHNALANGLMALEGQVGSLQTTVAGLTSGAGSGSAAAVDLTLVRSGTLETHRVTSAGGVSYLPDLTFYVPRDFTLEYFAAHMEVGPVGGPIDVVLVAGNDSGYDLTLPVGTNVRAATTLWTGEYDYTRRLQGGYFSSDLLISVSVFYDGSAVTSLGRDLTVYLGGRAGDHTQAAS